MHRDSNVKSAADDGIKMQKKCETMIIIKMEPRHILDVAKLEAEIFSVPWSQQAFAGALEMDQAFFMWRKKPMRSSVIAEYRLRPMKQRLPILRPLRDGGAGI